MSRGCNLTDEDLDGLQNKPSLQCDNSGCGTGCSSGNECSSAAKQQSGGSWDRLGSNAQASTSRATCMKCKAVPAQVAVRQREPLCKDCLTNGVVHKTRLAKATLHNGEKLMIAASGGPSSLALLHCMLHWQSSNRERPERGKVAVELVVVHVQEGQLQGLSQEQQAQHTAAVTAAVQSTGFTGEIVIAELADVYASSSGSSTSSGSSRREQLGKLLEGIKDGTGREDMAGMLRSRLLLHLARQHGCGKLLQGDNASIMAGRIISDVTKGRGYSLPADIQLVDCRALPDGGPTVVYPLREVTAKECACLCWYNGYPMAGPGAVPAVGKTSVNQLAAMFIDSLQANLPSAVYTITKTAGSLKCFDFNDVEAAGGRPRQNSRPAGGSTSTSSTSSRRDGAASCGRGQGGGAGSQQQQDGGDTAGAAGAGKAQFCAVCSAPLTADEAAGASLGAAAGDGGAAAAAAAAAAASGLGPACYSCSSQIISRYSSDQPLAACLPCAL